VVKAWEELVTRWSGPGWSPDGQGLGRADHQVVRAWEELVTRWSRPGKSWSPGGQGSGPGKSWSPGGQCLGRAGHQVVRAWEELVTRWSRLGKSWSPGGQGLGRAGHQVVKAWEELVIRVRTWEELTRYNHPVSRCYQTTTTCSLASLPGCRRNSLATFDFKLNADVTSRQLQHLIQAVNIGLVHMDFSSCGNGAFVVTEATVFCRVYIHVCTTEVKQKLFEPNHTECLH